ncbi:SRPBCC family protein [Streptomyces sp. NPDC058001]|uniref:SRPBCC family protein n=1 Tax=Streptomyces sp. NPDC058001 TaxID=3346300 RepID=UPI0036E5D070
MARRLSPVGLDFLSKAPLCLVFAREISASPESVHRALTEDVASLPEWFRAVTFARPTQDGAGREVKLRGGVHFEETILVSKAPEEYAYRVDTTNTPGLRALLEEWRLTPTADGTRVQWTFAADGSAPFRFALRLGRAGLGRAFRDAVSTLDRRLASANA